MTECMIRVLLVLYRGGSVWRLIGVGFSSVEIYNSIIKLENKRLIVKRKESYMVTVDGVNIIKNYIKTRNYHKSYLLSRVEEKINKLWIYQPYLSIDFLLEKKQK